MQPVIEPTRTLVIPAQESVVAGTSLGPGVSVKGEIIGREDLFVDGEVRGTIHIDGGKLTVGPNGRVTADMDAQEIIIHGRVEGHLRGRERVQITRTGQVTGDTVTPRIQIEEGAVYRGKVDTVGPEQTRAGRPAAAPAKDASHAAPLPTKYSQT